MTINNDDFIDYLGNLETKGALADAKKVNALRSAVLKKAGLKKRASGVKKLGRVLLIAAAVSVCAVVTAAAIGFNFGDMFRGYFEAAEPHRLKSAASLTQSQIDVLDKSGKAINQSVTCSGTAITVKAAVGDQNSTYILFDLTAPAGTKLSRSDYDFEDIPIDFHNKSGEGPSLGWDIIMQKDPAPNDNKKTFVLRISSAGMDLRGRELSLTLTNFSTPGKRKLTFDHVIAGTWKFNFILGNGNGCRELTVNKATHFKALVNSKAPAEIREKENKITYQCTINKVSLSSLSATVDCSFKKTGTASGFIVPFTLTVNMKSGAHFVVAHNGPGTGNSTSCSTAYLFDQPVDINSVSSITLGDLTIPVS